jgi:hypothetical protein
MQDHNFVVRDRIEDRVPKTPDVPAAYARHFGFLRHVGIIEKSNDCVFDAVSEIGNG